MKYKIIATGSTGNAVIIGGKILIDCGVTFKRLKAVCDDIELVLLTHIHLDHFKPNTIKKLSEERPTLKFVCCDWLEQNLLDCGIDKKNIDVLQIGKWYKYAEVNICPVKLYHNVPNCGYRLFFGKEKVFYATDTCTLAGISARNYDLYMVEANYNLEELIERINKKTLIGKYAYEKNVPRNHLSIPECNEFLQRNAGENSECVYLHQHIDRT